MQRRLNAKAAYLYHYLSAKSSTGLDRREQTDSKLQIALTPSAEQVEAAGGQSVRQTERQGQACYAMEFARLGEARVDSRGGVCYS